MQGLQHLEEELWAQVRLPGEGMTGTGHVLQGPSTVGGERWPQDHGG